MLEKILELKRKISEVQDVVDTYEEELAQIFTPILDCLGQKYKYFDTVGVNEDTFVIKFRAFYDGGADYLTLPLSVLKSGNIPQAIKEYNDEQQKVRHDKTRVSKLKQLEDLRKELGV